VQDLGGERGHEGNHTGSGVGGIHKPMGIDLASSDESEQR
jgi:hypothetical protein